MYMKLWEQPAGKNLGFGEQCGQLQAAEGSGGYEIDFRVDTKSPKPKYWTNLTFFDKILWKKLKCFLVHYIDWSDLNRLELTWTDFKLT